MRIAMIASGESIHSARWVDYFAQKGHEVHWISLAPFTMAVPAGVRVYDVGGHSRWLGGVLRAIWRTRRLLRALAPDLLQVHSVGTYGLVGAATGFHPVVATAWGSDILLATRSRFKRPLIRFVLRHADVLTCDAYHMRDAITKLGATPSKIHVIFFGTDTGRFRPGLDSTDIRVRFGVGKDLVILSTRSLEPIYDIATLIRAMPRVLAEVSTARCVIVGKGSEREVLNTLARQLGVAERVAFVGAVTGDDMPRVLAAADIYVSTSLSDAGLAASTAEAMATQLPVVVSDSAENRMWVDDGVGGFLVPVRDPGALAEKLVYLIRSPEERQRFGLHNRRIIEKRNNYAVEMAKIEHLYREVSTRAGVPSE